jgi:deazaflavin-dependent oxidoreductase (nitroreductase family)
METMNLRHSVTDIGFKVLGATHRAVLRLPLGNHLKTGFGMPFVELHTLGRKSGQPRVTILTAPIHDDHRVVLVASKGGDDRDPQWYRNLTVNPDVEIHIDGQVRRLRARTASPQEKEEIWPQILRVYRGYGSYQKRTGRDIPVVICEPRPL